jgi:hypothetical protein
MAMRQKPLAGPALLAALVFLLAACARLPLPGLAGASGDEGMAALLENRLWAPEGHGIPGEIRAFLGSGELVIASCLAVPRVARWRWIGPAEIEWTDEGRRERAEIALVGPDELVLLVEEAGFARSLAFRTAPAGAMC